MHRHAADILEGTDLFRHMRGTETSRATMEDTLFLIPIGRGVMCAHI